MRLASGLILPLVAIFLAACSNRQVYEAAQENRKIECQKSPPGQFEACLVEHNESYESYERERKEIVGEAL
jgi:hypothetical protein